MKATKPLPPPPREIEHPGIYLAAILKAEGISQTEFCRNAKIAPATLSNILSCNRGINPRIALALGDFTPISGATWMLLQAYFDLEEEKKKQGR